MGCKTLPDPAPVPWCTITAARSYRLLPEFENLMIKFLKTFTIDAEVYKYPIMYIFPTPDLIVSSNHVIRYWPGARKVVEQVTWHVEPIQRELNKGVKLGPSIGGPPLGCKNKLQT